MPEIQIPQPKVQDIYSFGFGKDLIKEKSSQLSEFENTLNLYGSKINSLSSIKGQGWISVNIGNRWTGSTGTPSIGNGTCVMRYKKDNQYIIDVEYYLLFGTTTSTAGAGFWRLPLPFTQNINQQLWTSYGFLKNSGVGYYPIIGVPQSTTMIEFYASDTVPMPTVGEGQPFAWATDSFLKASLRYETIE